MENPLKIAIKRKESAAPVMHSEPFSEFVGKSRRWVHEAVEGRAGTAGGWKGFNWLTHPKNKNTPEAEKFKDGKLHVFFGTAFRGDRHVLAVHWSEAHDKFVGSAYRLDDDWDDDSRAVLEG